MRYTRGGPARMVVLTPVRDVKLKSCPSDEEVTCSDGDRLQVGYWETCSDGRLEERSAKILFDVSKGRFPPDSRVSTGPIAPGLSRVAGTDSLSGYRVSHRPRSARWHSEDASDGSLRP